LKKEHKSIIPGGAMVIGGVCSMYLQHYIRVISIVQKGRDYLEESKASKGEHSKFKQGSSPKRRMALFH
jgi:hypothetical protein